MRCTCKARFRSDNRTDAWALLQGHITEMAAIDELLHAFDGEEEESTSAADPISLTEEIAVRRDDLTAQMERRNFGSWSDEEETQFLIDLIRWTAMNTHDAYHQIENVDWQQCRRSTCLYAALALPENKGGIRG